MVCIYIHLAEEHWRKTRVRKSTLKSWNGDLFCDSAMELILVILKMASGYPPGHFSSQEVHSKPEPQDHHIVMCMSKCCGLYLNSYCVYTSLYMHAPTFSCTYKNTCHFVITLQITVFEEKRIQFIRKDKEHSKTSTCYNCQNCSELWITKFMFLAKILIKYLTANCSGVISSVSIEVKM